MSMINSGLHLDFTIGSRTTVLGLSFQLSNETGRDWGVFDRVPSKQIDGSTSYSPAAIYVDIDGETLHLGKYLLPVPPGLQVAYRVVPGITVLRHGRSLTETLHLPVPVPADNPYRRALLSGSHGGATVHAAKSSFVSRIMLHIGVFPLSADEDLHVLSPAFPEVFRVWPPGRSMQTQIILNATAVLEAPLAVLDYEVAG